MKIGQYYIKYMSLGRMFEINKLPNLNPLSHREKIKMYDYYNLS